MRLPHAPAAQGVALSVRRHDYQALPPSTCTLDHHGQASLSMFMYLCEHVVIGPVNHVYNLRATVEKLFPTMVLRPSHPAPNRGSRKEFAVWDWFAELPDYKFEGSQACDPILDQLSPSKCNSHATPLLYQRAQLHRRI